MDLSSLDLTPSADAGASMIVLHPVTDEPVLNDAGLPMTIQLVGSESSIMREETKIRAKKQLNRKSKTVEVEDAIKASSELLAACTVGWSNVQDGGSELKHSRENATMLYIKYQWLRQQVDGFVSDRSNFFKA